MKTICRLLPAIALLALAPVRADDVTDNLAAAKDAYEAGQISQAITAIDSAAQFLRQKKAELVAKILPDAPKGWEASEPETEAAAASLLGGGVTVQRRYTRDSSSVTIKVQSDSAIMQAAMSFNNPMLLAASGAKLETIQGQQVSVHFEKGAKNGSIKAVIEGRYSLEIEGEEVTADDLRVFAKAFPFAKLTKL
jgi:stage V sporulation protein SpoVS